MRVEACRTWRSALGASALGELEPAAARELNAHLDGCLACRRAARELGALASSLAAADPERVLDRPVAGARVLEPILAAVTALARDARASRRRRTLGALSAAAVGAGAGVLALVLGPSPAAAPQVRVALAAADAGITGSAVLEARLWGTQVALRATGLPGTTEHVWLERVDGTRVAAGTFTGVPGRPLRVTLAAALAPAQAVAVGLSTDDGTVMLRGRLPGR